MSWQFCVLKGPGKKSPKAKVKQWLLSAKRAHSAHSSDSWESKLVQSHSVWHLETVWCRRIGISTLYITWKKWSLWQLRNIVKPCETECYDLTHTTMTGATSQHRASLWICVGTSLSQVRQGIPTISWKWWMLLSSMSLTKMLAQTAGCNREDGFSYGL